MSKSLKEQNRWQIWLIVSANALVLLGVTRENAISLIGLNSAFDTHNLIPVGTALTISIVLNGLLSADAKSKLVFLRWHNTLPGHRAFSKYAKHDPRIDLKELQKLHGSMLPEDPIEENRVWFRMYKDVENTPAVLQVHRDFLLLRDYTGLSILFLFFLGSIGFYAIESLDTAELYCGMLFIQYVIVRQAASNYGIRMVTTVLSEKMHSKSS
ncbi:hypothetical protein C8R26_11748 [Nitrosomonas oligotropha]|uniref:Uncharacterized protein n=1 Tax=Nitrosomonas oligotropha TaxID=42354 RepID=A0A2T5HXZ3_9PROT|nr:hypothetical protein [Nitrosomonas oligotropha]PTQ76455.1 hypothetical protein C8R26_11748 [Nitrosomonas oligotropha]